MKITMAVFFSLVGLSFFVHRRTMRLIREREPTFWDEMGHPYVDGDRRTVLRVGRVLRERMATVRDPLGRRYLRFGRVLHAMLLACLAIHFGVLIYMGTWPTLRSCLFGD